MENSSQFMFFKTVQFDKDALFLKGDKFIHHKLKISSVFPSCVRSMYISDFLGYLKSNSLRKIYPESK